MAQIGRAFAEVITRIKPGMTELELQAELIYCMYKNGGTGLCGCWRRCTR